VGRAAFKKGSIPRAVAMPSHSLMHCALPPSEPPDGEHPCCFRFAAVGGAQPHGGWHPSAIARLQGFSSGSPAAFPHQWSRGMVTTGLMVGRSKPGYVCPALSFKDLHHPSWGGGRGKLGPASAWAGDPLLPPAFGGGNHPPALRRRRPPAMRRKANCCCLARVKHSILRPGDCGRLHRGVAQHVVRREGGTRVLRRSRSRSCGEDGSEDLPVRFGAVGGQVAAVIGVKPCFLLILSIGTRLSTS
jgi:hypothetical protein